MKYGSIIYTAFLCTVLWLPGTGAMAADRIPIFVSILPQKYFVEKIGGDRVTVSVMVQPGASPSTYEPRPIQMMGLSKARIYYAIGVPFEAAWLNKFSAINPDMKIVLTYKGVTRVKMNPHANDGHHGAILDPHIWTSPPLVKIQAKNILDALLDIDPMHKSGYTARYNGFLKELDEIDADLRTLFSKKPHSHLVLWSFIRPGAILPEPMDCVRFPLK